MLDHTALLNPGRESREALGYKLYVENQNSFLLRGQYATLAGKPDLIAVKNSEAVIIDAKTGRTSPHHAVQVMIYQYAVPKALEQYRGVEFKGHVAYTESNVEIPTSRIDTNFVDSLGSLIRRLAADNPPRKVPSYAACRFCDISKVDCPKRMEGQPLPRTATTDGF